MILDEDDIIINIIIIIITSINIMTIKVVLGAGLWNLPHIVILDEPTNFLDRDSLGALATAIKGDCSSLLVHNNHHYHNVFHNEM